MSSGTHINIWWRSFKKSSCDNCALDKDCILQDILFTWGKKNFTNFCCRDFKQRTNQNDQTN